MASRKFSTIEDTSDLKPYHNSMHAKTLGPFMPLDPNIKLLNVFCHLEYPDYGYRLYYVHMYTCTVIGIACTLISHFKYCGYGVP